LRIEDQGTGSTIATYRTVADARIAQDALAAEGIEADVEAGPETLARNIRLRVRNEDAIRAGAVLDARCAWIGESEEPSDEHPPEPSCICENGEHIRSARALSFSLIAVLTIGFALAFGTGQAAFFAILAAAVYFLIADRWHCGECGASWN
jgi:hypothetical protein